MHFEIIDGAASVAAQYAGGVGVVDHHDGAVLLRQIAQRGEQADVAVHGEDSVGDQQPFSGLIFDADQALLRLGNVLVFEDQDFGAGQGGGGGGGRAGCM